MPSLASRIIELHAQNLSREEIISHTGCKPDYLRSVLSRASAPDEETRKLRFAGKPKGSLQYNASLVGWATRIAALRKGKTLEQARAERRRAERAYLKEHRVDAAPSRKATAIATTRGRAPRDGSNVQHKEARP